MTADQATPYASLPQVYLYAMRNPNEDGWRLAETQMNSAEVVRWSLRQGVCCCLVKHRGRAAPFEGWNEWPPPPTLMNTDIDGWTYDPPARRWRAPSEPLTLDRDPARIEPVETVLVQLSPPEYGWLPFAISGGTQQYAFEASDVYDPFRDLTTWIQRIAIGEYPRLLIDCEDIYAIFQCLPAADDRVRLAVIERYESDDIGLDVVVPRTRLVEAFYVPFVRLWDSWNFRQAWEENWDPSPGCVERYEVRDLTTERYLEAAGLMRNGRSVGAHDELENTLLSHRWVRVMADDCADGVWDIEGAGCCNTDLPVSQDLRDRITAWQDWYDREGAEYLEDVSRRPGPRDVAGFAAEGLAIATEVKRQLPDWTVVYHDESRPRGDLEYKIVLPKSEEAPASGNV